MRKCIVLGSVLMIAITACREDDEDSSILGTWKLNISEVRYGDGRTEYITPNSCKAQTTFTFTNDGKASAKLCERVGTTCMNDTYDGSYTYNASQRLLTLSYNDYHQNFNVKTLKESELIVLSESLDYDGDGKADNTYLHFTK